MTGSMLYDLNRYPYMLICLLESKRPAIHAKEKTHWIKNIQATTSPGI